MLERLAAWFLNTYVAEYVGNVVTDQLSIGLLKGDPEPPFIYSVHTIVLYCTAVMFECVCVKPCSQYDVTQHL